jgi:predicted tellurium resistance membrane protein TerC
MDWITEPQAWIGLATLTLLEIVLGVDNIVFISILTDRLPPSQQARARLIGLGLAMVMRILLLFSLTWIIQLTTPLFEVMGKEISGRDLVLIIGGLFLLGKSTHEIHNNLEGVEGERTTRIAPSLGGVLIQIMLLDIVFSLDSVITAVGMVDEIEVMIAAVIVAVGFMMVFSRPISQFVSRHPTVKMLALSFLLMIGIALIAEGLDQHIPKGYIYFAMAFSLGVELLNLRARRAHADVVRLRQAYTVDPTHS